MELGPISQTLDLNDLGRRIVGIVVSLIVLVPLVTRVDAIEVAWLAGAVLVVPGVDLLRSWD